MLVIKEDKESQTQTNAPLIVGQNSSLITVKNPLKALAIEARTTLKTSANPILFIAES